MRSPALSTPVSSPGWNLGNIVKACLGPHAYAGTTLGARSVALTLWSGGCGVKPLQPSPGVNRARRLVGFECFDQARHAGSHEALQGPRNPSAHRPTCAASARRPSRRGRAGTRSVSAAPAQCSASQPQTSHGISRREQLRQDLQSAFRARYRQERTRHRRSRGLFGNGRDKQRAASFVAATVIHRLASVQHPLDGPCRPRDVAAPLPNPLAVNDRGIHQGVHGVRPDTRTWKEHCACGAPTSPTSQRAESVDITAQELMCRSLAWQAMQPALALCMRQPSTMAMAGRGPRRPAPAPGLSPAPATRRSTPGQRRRAPSR